MTMPGYLKWMNLRVTPCTNHRINLKQTNKSDSQKTKSISQILITIVYKNVVWNLSASWNSSQPLYILSTEFVFEKIFTESQARGEKKKLKQENTISSTITFIWVFTTIYTLPLPLHNYKLNKSTTRHCKWPYIRCEGGRVGM